MEQRQTLNAATGHADGAALPEMGIWFWAPTNAQPTDALARTSITESSHPKPTKIHPSASLGMPLGKTYIRLITQMFECLLSPSFGHSPHHTKKVLLPGIQLIVSPQSQQITIENAASGSWWCSRSYDSNSRNQIQIKGNTLVPSVEQPSRPKRMAIQLPTGTAANVQISQR